MNEIGIQDLIYQVKNELLAFNRREMAKDPYPLFVIDNIELEISVNVSQSKGGGVKLTVLDFAEISSTRTKELDRGHVVKISLSSLLSREALLHDILIDPEKREWIFKRTEHAFVKGQEEDSGFRD